VFTSSFGHARVVHSLHETKRHHDVTRGFYLLMAAQFVSGLADNALLVVTIARLNEVNADPWLAPLLKLVFTLAYVVLAPFVGVLADRWPKAQVMMQSNLLKATGCVLIGLAVNPLLAFAVAGLGAACYSPAKYGLVTELVPPEQLVRANSWIEVSMVCAIILGTLLGGLLVSDWFAGLAQLDMLSSSLWMQTSLYPALAVVLALYMAASALNRFIPDSGARYAKVALHVGALVARFRHANATLWRDPMGRLSLSVTTLFWGAGATLQFVVLQWAQDSLSLQLDQAAYLQGVVALGITVGAGAAGYWVSLHQAPRVLALGVLMGLLVPLMAHVNSVPVAVPLLALVGALAGFFVVPMNALLQHRGRVLLSAGESIAVQNFNENLSVLLMLAGYSALLAAHGSINALIYTLGLVLAGCMAWVMRKHFVSSTSKDESP
jgi:MFS transporter, LPLT family, lysophospholipid transporter